MTPYRAVLLRYFHEWGLGEFLNIGIVIWNNDSLYFKISLNTERASNFFPSLIDANYKSLVTGICKEWEGRLKAEAGEMLFQPYSLLSQGSGCFQWSPSVGGAGASLQKEGEDLYEDYIGTNNYYKESHSHFIKIENDFKKR